MSDDYYTEIVDYTGEGQSSSADSKKTADKTPVDKKKNQGKAGKAKKAATK